MAKWEKKIRVFAISHSCVVKAYRQRHNAVNKRDEVEVTLLTPERWIQFNHLCEAPPLDENEHFNLIREQPSLGFLPDHGLRNACHFYTDLTKHFVEYKPHVLELWAEPYFALTWYAGRAFRALNPKGPILFFSAQNVHKWRPPPWSLFENWTFRNANFCMAMHEDVAPVLVQKGWQGPSEVIPMGVDLPRYERVEPLESVAKMKKPVIGFLGKMDDQKGVLDLVSALKALSHEDSFTALFVGNGPHFDEVKKEIEHLPQGSQCLPAVSHDEVPALLAAMDIVVMPSRTQKHLKEQFGRVAVEAMASGKAVIVSSSGALPSVVNDCGLVFPEGDVGALAFAITSLLIDKNKRDELGKRARQRVAEKYSWSVIANQFVDIYQRLVPPSEVD